MAQTDQRIRWAIVTGEYPPDLGGVSDYTRQVALGLVAAGDEVRVFTRECDGMPELDDAGGVKVHRLAGGFGPRALMRLERIISTHPRPNRILVQYVPHAYGFKAMNLPFAGWVSARAARFAPVWVMFHEVAVQFRWWPLRHALLGAATQAMARMIAAAADRLFVSTLGWRPLLKRISPRARPAEWLPVPCNVATEASASDVSTVRARFVRPGGSLVGHFGTFGAPIADSLLIAIPALLSLSPECDIVLVGRGSGSFRNRLNATHPGLSARIHAVGELSSVVVSTHLRACDLLLQPYPDGVSSRRTSVMSGLANGVAVVTNLGRLSEPIWAEGAVAAAPTPDAIAAARLAASLLGNPARREVLARSGQFLYRGMFGLEHTIDRLRAEAPMPADLDPGSRLQVQGYELHA
jgi:glycosyltransferase involved in cell wall biosynthesis